MPLKKTHALPIHTEICYLTVLVSCHFLVKSTINPGIVLTQPFVGWETLSILPLKTRSTSKDSFLGLQAFTTAYLDD